MDSMGQKIPLVSIITVCYNNLEGLKRTYESIKEQTFCLWEWVVIDGGSNDGTIEYLNSIDSDKVKFKSENDNGIYDAMNKGALFASGVYLNFLNSGDTYTDEKTLSITFKVPVSDIIYGNFILIKMNMDKKVITPVGFNFNGLKYYGTGAVNHQAFFVRKKYFLPYNLRYQLKGEYDWYLRIFNKYNPSTCHINRPIVNYYEGGASSLRFLRNIFEYLIIITKRYGITHIYNRRNFIFRYLKFHLSVFFQKHFRTTRQK